MQFQVLESTGFMSQLHSSHDSGGMKYRTFYTGARLSNVHGGPVYTTPAHCPYPHTAVICYGAVVTMETVEVTLDPYQAFQMQSIHS